MVDGRHARKGIALVLPLLLLPAAARAHDPAGARAMAWRAAVSAGAGLPIPSTADSVRAAVDVTVGRVLHRRLELDVGLRYGSARLAEAIRVSAGAGLVLRPGPLELVIGARLGYAAVHVPRGELWTGALVVALAPEVRYRFGERWEISAAPATFTIHHNDFTIPAWEPSLGAGLRW